jgi:sulfatase modifying factor 1
MPSQEPDFYAVFGVLPSVEQAALAAVYRALVKKYHPDVFAGPRAEAERVTKELNEAYEVLGDPAKRAQYDARRMSSQERSGDYGRTRDTDPRSGGPERPKEETAVPASKDTTWKNARSGVLLFCGVHLICELLTENKSFTLPIFINYWISSWYIKREIAKRTIRNPLALGLKVSAAVFGIRLLLGLVFLLSTRTPKKDPATDDLTKVLGDLSSTSAPRASSAPDTVPTRQGKESLGKTLEVTGGKMLETSLPGGKAMRFCYCPPGQFIMGSPLNEPGRNTDENQVSVTISQGFWMAETEVTQEQWVAVMGSNPSSFKVSSRPVENVSWYDAQEMVGKLNQVIRPPNGLKFALPTEAQWEYACRAGTQTAYAFGSELTRRDANYGSKQVPVKSYRPNQWGLYDMHGNVWEWCEDWKRQRLQGGVDPRGPSSGVYRVYRGGSWNFDAVCCRAAYRSGDEPGFRFLILGFRPALVPSK